MPLASTQQRCRRAWRRWWSLPVPIRPGARTCAASIRRAVWCASLNPSMPGAPPVALVPRPISFVPGKSSASLTASKPVPYVPINGVSAAGESGALALKQQSESLKRKRAEQAQLRAALAPDADGFTPPMVNLFPEAKVLPLLQWKDVRKVGGGLHNLGNTCFLNSVLQCLTYTPALAQYLMSMDHSQNCRVQGFCAFCALERHVIKALSSHGQAFSPREIVKNIKLIARHFRLGRQEDAHEFMRYLVDGLQRSAIGGDPKTAPRRAEETTVISRIFGGYLRSQIQCQSCKHESNTFDPFLDLDLSIKGCDSVEAALARFTRPDRLEGDNRYNCDRCAKRVPLALKRFTIHRAPNVLTLVLKRFEYIHSHGGKISKAVSFPPLLDIGRFLSRPDPSAVYELHGVLVHMGHSTHGGHYYSFVRGSMGVWYCMDDSHVSQVTLHTVLQQKAYMLFYSRVPSAAGARPADASAAASPVAPAVAAEAAAAAAASAGPVERAAAAGPTAPSHAAVARSAPSSLWTEPRTAVPVTTATSTVPGRPTVHVLTPRPRGLSGPLPPPAGKPTTGTLPTPSAAGAAPAGSSAATVPATPAAAAAAAAAALDARPADRSASPPAQSRRGHGRPRHPFRVTVEDLDPRELLQPNSFISGWQVTELEPHSGPPPPPAKRIAVDRSASSGAAASATDARSEPSVSPRATPASSSLSGGPRDRGRTADDDATADRVTGSKRKASPAPRAPASDAREEVVQAGKRTAQERAGVAAFDPVAFARQQGGMDVGVWAGLPDATTLKVSQKQLLGREAALKHEIPKRDAYDMELDKPKVKKTKKKHRDQSFEAGEPVNPFQRALESKKAGKKLSKEKSKPKRGGGQYKRQEKKKRKEEMKRKLKAAEKQQHQHGKHREHHHHHHHHHHSHHHD